MASTDVPMKEFLLWSNCPNNCQFCWQRKMDKAETNLTEAEKLQAIDAVKNEIATLDYTDILIVGGEVYCTHSQAVNDALIGLFELIKERIDNGLTRLMYANSNLLYDDLSVVMGLLDIFTGSEDKLRFTTSYDIYGRYSDEAHRQLFLNNLAYITQHYPKIHPVVNCILTSQMCDYITGGHFNIGSFAETYRLAFVNMIPYIPVEQGDIMTPTWSQVTGALTYIETIAPHYLHNYVYQLDFHQDRVLKEYHKSEGFVVCTSEYLACGHNSNYTRATDDGSCYVCKMKRTIAIESTDASENELSDLIQEGRKIVTVGDYCSHYIWNHYRQPDLVVYDGVTSSENEIDVEMLVRQSQTKRVLVINDGPYLGDELRDAVKNALGTLDERSAIRVEGEEDSAVFECLNSAPIGTVVIYGDSNKRCMSYYIIK